MLTHVVLYKLKAEVTPEEREKLLAEARRRLATIPGVMNLRAGTSIYPDDPYQAALVMDFEGIEGLDQYRVHPTHVKFLQEVATPLVDEVRRLDYVDQ